VSTEESRDLTSKYAPFITTKHLQQVEAYKVMPLEELFIVQEVAVEIPETDLPGPSRFKAVCRQCGQVVRDGKEVVKNGQVLCVPCALGAYYRLVKTQKAVA
jgi:formylmethanofuran dehydrogenase subunit E